MQAKPGKREVVTIARFKEEEGVMNAGCWCKSHDLEGRMIYDMHEMDPEQNEVSAGLVAQHPSLRASSNSHTDLGTEADADALQTALQIYTSSYKGIPPDDSFALLRKATRLTNILPTPPTPKSVEAVEKVCAECETDASPIWHEIDDITLPNGIANDGIEANGNGDERMDVDLPPQSPNGDATMMNGGLLHDGETMDVEPNGHAQIKFERKDAEAKGMLCHQCWFRR